MVKIFLLLLDLTKINKIIRPQNINVHKNVATLCSDCKKQQQNTLVILAGGESIIRPITMSLSTVCSTAAVES